MDIVLVTEDRYENPPVINDYIANLLQEDAMLTKALNTRGIRVARYSWSNASVDWSRYDLAIFRTTWDYFHKFNAFKQWLHDTAEKTTFLNAIDTVWWNLDKRYLRDMQNSGIRIVQTVFKDAGDPETLESAIHKMEGDAFIIKPAVSGAARDTYRFTRSETAVVSEVYERLVQQEAMLIQPFVQSILSKGEVSLMLFGGKFSHAVIKNAKAGDFRVQDDFGGSVTTYTPNAEEISFAEETVRATKKDPVYARVDIADDANGDPALMELELVEPELWMRFYPPAAEQFAAYIYDRLP